MAPEVLQKGAMAMPADVYSFAMLMLELWTGEIVYSGINSHQVTVICQAHYIPQRVKTLAEIVYSGIDSHQVTISARRIISLRGPKPWRECVQWHQLPPSDRDLPGALHPSKGQNSVRVVLCPFFLFCSHRQ